MPLTLSIRQDEHTPVAHGDAKLTFDGARVVIGRGSSSDVRLPDPSVSQRHATIQAKGSEYTIIDEGSTNGSWIGGVRLASRAPRLLRTGDVLRVGRVWLEVTIDQTPPTADLPSATRDLALALVSQAMRSLGDDTHPRVRIVEGRDVGSALVLSEEGRVYLIGRGENCELGLADVDASREHVQIVRRQNTVLARDLGSKNGASLGEQPVPFGRDIVWKSTSMMRIGSHVLALEEPVTAALSELESALDETMSPEEQEAPAPSEVRDAIPSQNMPPASVAPIAHSTKTVAVARKKKSVFSPTDLGVIAAAAIVIGLSVAGLLWLLRG